MAKKYVKRAELIVENNDLMATNKKLMAENKKLMKKLEALQNGKAEKDVKAPKPAQTKKNSKKDAEILTITLDEAVEEVKKPDVVDDKPKKMKVPWVTKAQYGEVAKDVKEAMYTEAKASGIYWSKADYIAEFKDRVNTKLIEKYAKKEDEKNA